VVVLALRTTALLLVAALLAGCQRDPTGPATAHRIVIHTGDGQVAGTGAILEEPLQAVVTDALSEQPVRNISVSWSVVQGAGAQILEESGASDASGIVSAQLRLGSDTGTYVVQAQIRNSRSQPARFTVRAVLPPRIDGISPASAVAGDTVTLTGVNFSPRPEDNTVLFGGLAGGVTGATATLLRVVVPECIPTSTVAVVARLGGAASAPVSLQVTGKAAAALDLQPGAARTFRAAAELACVRLPGLSNAAYLVIPQNSAVAAGVLMPFQLAGVLGPAPLAAPAAVYLDAWLPPRRDAAIEFENWLRARERAIPRDRLIRPSGEPFDPLSPLLQIGDRRSFNVITRQQTFTSVTAEVVAIGDRAVIYQDLTAPAGGFTSSDYRRFADLFDDPIHPASTAVFGQPSDVDGNGRVIILFTPVVNEMTPRGAGGGFVAGFFFSHDLTTLQGSNRAEIFYSIVPDPTGIHSDARATASLRGLVPPVLGHEFQHMIHFNERNLRLGSPTWESLWLSEGLAHLAEDLIGEVLLARGDTLGNAFQRSNFGRAAEYLADPPATSLVATVGQGTLAERGAAWLFLRYLMGHYGGEDLIRSLTQTTQSSTTNVTARTGVAWDVLFAQFAIALWADGAAADPHVAAPLDTLHTIAGLDLRSRYTTFPLQPRQQAYADFVLRGSLPPSSQAYVMIGSPGGNARPLHVGLGGQYGAAFRDLERPQLSIYRSR
jgi:hypothetical protein